MLKVKLLVPTAKAPTVAHPGEDLGYDIYAAVEITIAGRNHGVVPTGIAIEITDDHGRPMGALLRDKSSMAAKRMVLTGGVIDSGYRGEIKVLMENLGDGPATIHAGDGRAAAQLGLKLGWDDDFGKMREKFLSGGFQHALGLCRCAAAGIG